MENEQNQPHNQTRTNNQSPVQNKPQTGIINTLGQLLPLAPLFFEQFTDQKFPAINDNFAEINLAMYQVQVSLQAIVNNQQQLSQRISQLEGQAQSQFTNLFQQVQSIKSLRLTHDRERKRIEFNNQSDFDKSRPFNHPQN